MSAYISDRVLMTCQEVLRRQVPETREILHALNEITAGLLGIAEDKRYCRYCGKLLDPVDPRFPEFCDLVCDYRFTESGAMLKKKEAK
jgi:hypothetical protein